MEHIKPFEDLIKTIEYDGNTFVPIEEIAKLAIENYFELKYSNISSAIVPIDDSFSACSGYISNSECRKFVIIHDNFDVSINEETYDDFSHLLTCNQVQIIKNLIKWGFVEP